MISISYLFLAAICLYAVRVVVGQVLDWRKAKRLRCLPGHLQKNRLPFGIDQLLRLNKADRENHIPEEYLAMFNEEKAHTFEVSMLGSRYFQTSEPKNIQAILATQFRDFELGEIRRQTFLPFLGNGIFTDDGKAWEHSRAMLRPQFVREQVADLDMEERHVQTLLKLLPLDSSSWTREVDLVPMFFRLTIDSATEFLFGESVESQEAAVHHFLHAGHSQNDKWAKLAKAFDSGTKHIGLRMRLVDLYWLHNPKDFRNSIKEVQHFADYFVQRAIAQRRSEKAQGADAEKPQRYVFLKELAKVTDNPVELRSQMINILLAGRDTTASLLSWTFWLLARHPAVYNTLRNEVLEQFGPYDNPKKITFHGLKSCTYLQHVMNEVLRLYPPVPLNGRTATKDTTIPVGGGPDGQSPLFVKKGQEVAYYVYITHRRKDLWGENADAFDPSRWASKRPGWDFLPFNGGPRICLGQQFALTEAGYVITRLVQRFDAISTSDLNNVPKHNFTVTDAPTDCFVRLHESPRS